jgi:hypothetical protein
MSTGRNVTNFFNLKGGRNNEMSIEYYVVASVYKRYVVKLSYLVWQALGHTSILKKNKFKNINKTTMSPLSTSIPMHPRPLRNIPSL